MAIHEPISSSASPSKLNKWIAFITSCALHLFFCVVLACIYTMSGDGQGGNSILLGLESDSEIVTLTDTTFDSPMLAAETQLPDAITSESSVPAILTSYEVTLDSESTLETDEALAEGILSALSSLDSELSEITGDGAAGIKPRFYGTELEGNRFVFVIDSSTSMEGERWTSLKRELIRCIRGLSPDQKFFVISFDSECHPMFGKAPPEGKFLGPTPSSIKKLQRWLNGITLGDATWPATSLDMAVSLEPDAIMLLSDGEIRDDSIRRLRTANRRVLSDDDYEIRIPIHTYLLHSDAGYQTLKSIAEENDGVFTPINLMGHGRR